MLQRADWYLKDGNGFIIAVNQSELFVPRLGALHREGGGITILAASAAICQSTQL